MAWFLFLDESGTDLTVAPYEVLAGVAVEDRVLWALIQQLKDLQEHYFGVRLFDAYGSEAKGSQLLKKKVFKHAGQSGPIQPQERTPLAKDALQRGGSVSGHQLTALGQAKIAYVDHALRLCLDWHVCAFASIVPNDVMRPSGNFLRKDYAFLFERFYNFLSEKPEKPMGMIIFDEHEKTLSHQIAVRMENYFLKTEKGRQRSKLIIPEPLFVHSDLTTMVQMADLVAYIINWGVKLKGVNKQRRGELGHLAQRVCDLRYKATSSSHPVWGFKVIKSLMTNGESAVGCLEAV